MSNSLDLATGRRNRNKIVNPDGALDQRNAGAKVIATTSGNTFYGPDRRFIASSQASKLSIQQYNIALSAKQPTNYSTKVVVEATATTAAADNHSIFLQAFEGLRMRDLLWGSSFARPVVYTLLAQVPVAGTYAIAMRNGAANRSYVTTMTFSQANTPEQHSILIPGDTTGTWPTDTSYNSSLTMSLGAGPNYTTSNLNQWQAGNFIHASGATNLMGTAGQAVYILYDQFEREFATDFEIISDITEVERACQRYYEKGSIYFDAALDTTSGARGMSIPYKVTKRTAAAVTKTDSGVATTADDFQVDRFRIYTTTASGQVGTNWVCPAELV